MFGLSIYGYTKGNIYKLIGGLDGDHNICGATSGYEKYNKLYLTNLGKEDEIKDIFKKGVCVKECPSEDSEIDCQPTTEVKDCNSKKIREKQYDTVDVAGYCFPKNLDNIPGEFKESWDSILDDIKSSQAGKVLNDLKITRKAVFSCLALALVYSIIFIYMMSRFANCLAKLAILVIELCMIGSIGVSFFLRSHLTHNSDHDKKVYLILGIVMIVVFSIFNMFLCCFWKQIEVAIAVIDATADFFAATKRIVFTSILYFFVTFIVFVAWIAAVSGVMSLNDIQPTYESPQGKDIDFKASVNFMLAFMIFGFIWLVFWIQDKTGFICMVSAASYYFTSTKQKEGSASVMKGFHYAYFKHGGSLAFGSLVNTLISIVRYIVEASSDAIQKGGEANVVTQVLLCCAKCLVRCLESFVEYLNKTSYAYMAVSGDSYCKSAWNGFLLNLKHNAKYTFATTLAYMFVFLGKIFITCLNCATFYLITRYITKNVDDVQSIWGPVAIIGITTFITAHIFLCLFDEATIATLHCLAIDMDLNEGKPQYGPPTFHDKIERVYGNHHKVHQQRAHDYQQLQQTHQIMHNQTNTQTGGANAMY